MWQWLGLTPLLLLLFTCVRRKGESPICDRRHCANCDRLCVILTCLLCPCCCLCYCCLGAGLATKDAKDEKDESRMSRSKKKR